MSVWRNVTEQARRIDLLGTDPMGFVTVQPGDLICLEDRHDDLIQGGGPGAFERVDVQALMARVAELEEPQADQVEGTDGTEEAPKAPRRSRR